MRTPGDHHAAAWRVFSRLVRRHAHVPGAPDGRQRLSPTPTRATRPPASRTSARPPRTGSAPRRRWRWSRAWRAAGRHLEPHARRSTCAGRERASAGATPRPARSTRQGREGLGFLDRLRGGARAALRHHARRPSRAARRRSTIRCRATRYVIPGAGNPPPAVPIARAPHRRPRAGRAAGRGDQGGGRADHAGAGRRAARPPGSAARSSRAWPTTTSSTSPRARSTGSRATRAPRRCTARTRGRSSSSSSPSSPSALAAGQPAPDPYALDPSYGVKPDGTRLPGRAPITAPSLSQPAAQVERLGRAVVLVAGRRVGPRPAGRPRVRLGAAPRPARALAHRRHRPRARLRLAGRRPGPLRRDVGGAADACRPGRTASA